MTLSLFNLELEYLKMFFVKNEYPESIIDRFIINDFILKLKTKIVNPTPPQNNYIYSQLTNICKKIKIKFGVSKTINIGQILVTQKSKKYVTNTCWICVLYILL